MISRRARFFSGLLIAVMVAFAAGAAPRVVINEIHYNPAAKRPLEFVELHNPTAAEMNLSGWTLQKFTFPPNTMIPAHGFAVVAQDPDACEKEFGFRPLGPLPGRLSHRGEKIVLRNGRKEIVDEVSYGVGFPWPTAANGVGSSLERVNPDLPSANPGSWRSAGFPVVAPISAGTIFIPAEDKRWRWRKGTNEASQPLVAWRQLDFVEDGSWQTGQTSIGYADDDDNTVLTDMQGRYSSLFLRHTFVMGTKIPPALLLRIRVDDGCIVWINGTEVGRFHIRAGEIPFNGLAENHEAGDEFEETLLDQVARFSVPGTNLLAVQVFNASLKSSDLTIDAELRTPEGSPRGRRPTPGTINSVFAVAALPSITAVSHQPAAPKSGEPVLVTARVADGSGVQDVTVQLQFVEPGIYVRKTDAQFQTNWITVPMRDDGRNGDVRAGDGVFTATVPGEMQRHRRLARYRINVTTKSGLHLRAPFADDPSPNFAWFVYDGVPAWTGASQPGRTPPVTFPAEFLRTVPAYHLLARTEDVARSQWDGGANRKRFLGTLIYEGRVYDHIQFHNRGTGSAYISGKNKWGFKFNHGHELIARDLHGRAYESTWDSLNLNPGLSTPYLPVLAGIAGLDEAFAFRAFQLAGVPSANTFWIQFRVIDSAAESSTNSQYDGDLRGLYLAIEDMDGALLKERGLPDGNIYSIQNGRKHLARGAVTDNSDWNQFLNGVRNEHPEPWWRTNVNLPAYYSFHAISRVVGNVDVRPDGNHGYYRHPDGCWAPYPWDLDMLFAPRTHQPGYIDAIRSLNAPALRIEFMNRAREILDLFCADAAPDGGQVGQLVDELSQVLMPAGFTNNWGQLDAAVWNWNPHQNQKGLFYQNPAASQYSGGDWQRTLKTPDLPGFCRFLVEFCTDSRPQKNYAPNDGNQLGYGFGYLQHESKDQTVPDTPVVRASDAPGLAAKQPKFEVTPFASPVTNKFAAVQWRVGEISAPGLPGYVAGQPRRYEIEPYWIGEELKTPQATFRPPAKTFVAGHTYRVRARYLDHTGRWSHWSAPVQFVAKGKE